MKAEVYVLIATIVICQDYVDMLKLSLPKYVSAGDKIWVKCSSDKVPFDHIAEFLVDGVTTNIIRRHNNGCFSSITRKVCSKDACNCSSDGKSYSTSLLANDQIGKVEITCSMKLTRIEEMNQTEHLYIKDVENTTHKESVLFSSYASINYPLSSKSLTSEGNTDLHQQDVTTDTLKRAENRENVNNEGFLYGFLGVSLMLGLCFLSIPVIWLMLRYKHTVFNGRQDVAKLDTTHPVTNGTTSNTVVEQEFNSSDYESINDFDVNGSDILVHINRGPQREEKNIQTTSLPWTYNDLGISSSMTKHRFSNSNSTESSNNSYLEVIADTDYLNPYQIVKTRECGDDQHSYCLIANKNLRDCSSICNDSSNVQKVQCFRAYAKISVYHRRH